MSALLPTHQERRGDHRYREYRTEQLVPVEERDPPQLRAVGVGQRAEQRRDDRDEQQPAAAPPSPPPVLVPAAGLLRPAPHARFGSLPVGRGPATGPAGRRPLTGSLPVPAAGPAPRLARVRGLPVAGHALPVRVAHPRMPVVPRPGRHLCTPGTLVGHWLHSLARPRPARRVDATFAPDRPPRRPAPFHAGVTHRKLLGTLP